MLLYFKIICSFFFAVTSILQAQQSNLEIFTDLVKSIYSEEISTQTFDEKAVIVINQHQDSHEFRKIINAELKNWCDEKGFKLYSSSFSVPEQLQRFIYNFDFTPIQNNVVYEQKKDKINGNVLRTVQVQLLIKVEKNNNVLFDKRIKREFSDTIQADQFNQVETDFFAFTKGKRSQSLFSRLFEPALVSAATGTIIYLFYNFRSN